MDLPTLFYILAIIYFIVSFVVWIAMAIGLLVAYRKIKAIQQKLSSKKASLEAAESVVPMISNLVGTWIANKLKQRFTR